LHSIYHLSTIQIEYIYSPCFRQYSVDSSRSPSTMQYDCSVNGLHGSVTMLVKASVGARRDNKERIHKFLEEHFQWLRVILLLLRGLRICKNTPELVEIADARNCGADSGLRKNVA